MCLWPGRYELGTMAEITGKSAPRILAPGLEAGRNPMYFQRAITPNNIRSTLSGEALTKKQYLDTNFPTCQGWAESMSH